MKKDIEWLKEEVKEECEYNRAKHNKEGFEAYAHRKFAFKYVLKLIDQLDEPEALSQEWIDENKNSIDRKLDGTPIYRVREELLQSLLVPKKNLPVIPDYVAEYIEDQRKTGIASFVHEANPETSTKAVRWFYDGANAEVFMRAWLDGYTVEEKKYFICLPNISGEKEVYIWYEGRTKQYYTTNNKTIKAVRGNKIRFTEQEIKDYDERYLAFAVPVEELEE